MKVIRGPVAMPLMTAMLFAGAVDSADRAGLEQG
jgi:hypothetical protein